jgi:hypothetical protein
MEAAKYVHDLGNGVLFTGYAIDPNRSSKDIEDIVRKKDSPQNYSPDIGRNSCEYIARLGSFEDLVLRISNEGYEVPEQLREYRRVLGEKLDARRIASGGKVPADNNIIVATKPRIELPFDVTQTGYYNFSATNPDAKPCEILPDIYPQGKNIRELFQEWKLPDSARARYFALAYVLLTDNGDTINFSQRGKGQGIAAGIMSIFGSTPNPDNLYDPQFDFPSFIDWHIHEEIKEEFHMHRGEFRMNGIHFLNAIGSIPHAVIGIETKLSTEEIVNRTFKDPDVINEHPIIYCAKTQDIPRILDRFPFQAPTAFALSQTYSGW